MLAPGNDELGYERWLVGVKGFPFCVSQLTSPAQFKGRSCHAVRISLFSKGTFNF